MYTEHRVGVNRGPSRICPQKRLQLNRLADFEVPLEDMEIIGLNKGFCTDVKRKCIE